MRKTTPKGQARKDSIYAALKKQPMTVAQLAKALNMGASNVWVYVDQMRKATPKRVHISGHKVNTGVGAGRPAPIFSNGNKPDVEFVPNNRPGRKISAQERREQVLTLLREKPMTARQLGDRMHVVGATALIYLTKLKREGAVYISRWRHPLLVNPESEGGAWAPVYSVGNKASKPKPVAETNKERHARRKLDPAYMAEQRRRRNLRYRVEKLRGKPQGIFAALGL